jgi:hypothetical protein
MRLSANLSRTLVLLLALRVIAAPLALRPISPQNHTHRVVVRVCAWPASRSQRFAGSSCEAETEVIANFLGGIARVLDLSFRSAARLTRAILSQLAAAEQSGRGLLLSLARLRC